MSMNLFIQQFSSLFRFIIFENRTKDLFQSNVLCSDPIAKPEHRIFQNQLHIFIARILILIS